MRCLCCGGEAESGGGVVGENRFRWQWDWRCGECGFSWDQEAGVNPALKYVCSEGIFEVPADCMAVFGEVGR